jgi:transcriptional regulator with XRE-family HTH domain
MDESTPSLPERMAAIREAAGMSRAELAKKLGWTEIRVWRLETGKTKVLAEDVQAYADACKVTVGEVFGETAAAAG